MRDVAQHLGDQAPHLDRHAGVEQPVAECADPQHAEGDQSVVRGALDVAGASARISSGSHAPPRAARAAQRGAARGGSATRRAARAGRAAGSDPDARPTRPQPNRFLRRAAGEHALQPEPNSGKLVLGSRTRPGCSARWRGRSGSPELRCSSSAAAGGRGRAPPAPDSLRRERGRRGRAARGAPAPARPRRDAWRPTPAHAPAHAPPGAPAASRSAAPAAAAPCSSSSSIACSTTRS